MIDGPPSIDIREQIKFIEPLCLKLKAAINLSDKHLILDAIPKVTQFLASAPLLNRLFHTSDSLSQYAIKAILAIGQGPTVFLDLDKLENPTSLFEKLVGTLLDIEKFYEFIGGIVGYHLLVLQLIDKEQNPSEDSCQEGVNYDEPEGMDISGRQREVRQTIRWGLENMPQIAEIYPIGGAGDRLHLIDESTEEPLPAALLQFGGHTLLEGLLRDLQGREYLYYKLFDEQLITPIAVMTSHEKNNHQHILDICVAHNWFGRPQESFAFFIQRLVPMVALDGKWAMQGPLQPILKPGGHGVIWKLAQDQGAFDWLTSLHRKKAIVRQINNPVAGLDNGLLSLSGIGCFKNKDFGFASCPRLLHTAEGVDVLSERRVGKNYEYGITNIEYTKFAHSFIKDVPAEPGSLYSRFPANTNILFIDLQAVQSALKRCPFPGMLINLKSSVKNYEGDGQFVEKKATRLESTMQNIADYIVDSYPRRLKKGERGDLRTFLTYNKRAKTISVVKQAYEPGKPFVGTPEGCFYELMQNYADLLANYCGMDVPPVNDEEVYLKKGPSFVALFHPALGGLYSIIAQKIKGGHLANGAEWIMQIAEAEIVNLQLEGSLLIHADNSMGYRESDVLMYNSEASGKCTLIDVKVKNRGMSSPSIDEIWKCKVQRHEALQITLHGNGEFYAENVTIEGDKHFEVPPGKRMVVFEQDGKLVTRLENISEASWYWKYAFDAEDAILLEKQKSKSNSTQSRKGAESQRKGKHKQD